MRNIYIRCHLVPKLMFGHTHTHTDPTDCFTWTTKVVSKIF